MWRQGFRAVSSYSKVKHGIFANAKLASESLVGKLVEEQINLH